MRRSGLETRFIDHLINFTVASQGNPINWCLNSDHLLGMLNGQPVYTDTSIEQWGFTEVQAAIRLTDSTPMT